MSKHTPGPWQVIPSWGDWTIEGPNKEEIIFQDGPYQTPTIKLENARLIAAAPELLEALKYIVGTTFPMSGKQDQCWVVMQAVIFKATGETNAND